MRRVSRVLIVGVAALVGAAGCTVKKTSAPAMTGPSELGLSLSLEAIPDTITQDGASQAQVVVTARDPNGQPLANVSVRLDVTVGGTVVDFGSVSAKNVVTGSDGKVRVSYTAPPAPIDPVDNGTTVVLLVTPIGTNFDNAVARSVAIRLVPPGVILPPNGTPKAMFYISPQSGTEFQELTFDASYSTDDGAIVAYDWNFGDGSTGTGKLTTHRYSAAGEYIVTLTITDDRGLKASYVRLLPITAGKPPTAEFVISPTSPITNQDIYFNASASKAEAGHSIVSYEWDFGSGTPQRGVTVTKSYDVAGTYTVTLVVTDDAGRRGVTSRTVTIAAPGGGGN